MPPGSDNVTVISTASLRDSARVNPAPCRRSWWFEFFIAPFTDINEELADRMRATSERREARRLGRR